MLKNKKHIAFIDEYFLNGFNATQAYLSVYDGVKESTAQVNSSRLLSKAKLKDEIDKREDENRKKNEITTSELTTLIKRIMISTEEDSPSISIKAADFLAKTIGAFREDNLQKKDEVIIINHNKPIQSKDED